MNKTTRQHTIPKALIELFSNNNSSYVLLKSNNTIKSSHSKNIMVSKNFYESNHLETNQIEKTFSEHENHFVPFIKDINKKLENIAKRNRSAIDILNRIKLALYHFFIYYYRSSGFLLECTAFNDDQEFKIQEMSKKILNENYIVGLGETLCNYYNFCILVDPKERFILGDQYISTVSLDYKGDLIFYSNQQIGLTNTMVLFPISSKFYIAAYNGKSPKFCKNNQFCFLKYHDVLKINQIIHKNSAVLSCAKYSHCLKALNGVPNLQPSIGFHNIYEDNLINSTLPYNKICVWINKPNIYFYQEDIYKELSSKKIQSNYNDFIIDEKVVLEDPVYYAEKDFDSFSEKEKKYFKEATEFLIENVLKKE